MYDGLGAPGLVSALTGAALSQIGGIALESQVTPYYVFDPNAPAAGPSGPGSTSWFNANVAKPMITIYDRQGHVLMQYAPYGAPSRNMFWPIVGGLAIAGAGAGYLMYRGLAAPRTNPCGRKRNPRRRKAARRSARRRRRSPEHAR